MGFAKVSDQGCTEVCRAQHPMHVMPDLRSTPAYCEGVAPAGIRRRPAPEDPAARLSSSSEVSRALLLLSDVLLLWLLVLLLLSSPSSEASEQASSGRCTFAELDRCSASLAGVGLQ